MDLEASARTCKDLYTKCIENGYSLVGAHENEEVVFDALDRLEVECEGAIDLNEDQLLDLEARATEPEDESDDDLDKSVIELQPAYAAAMVFLTMTDGNPLKALAHVHNLARVTNEHDHYIEIMGTLLLTFPWLSEMAKQALGLTMQPE